MNDDTNLTPLPSPGVESTDTQKAVEAAVEGAADALKAEETPADGAVPVSSSPCKRRECGSGSSPRGKLHCFDYLADIPGGLADYEYVEVQFKNTRKGYYKNSQHIPVVIGDWVAVEASPGHDIGQVTLTGQLVRLQMRRAGVKNDAEVKRIFRKARPADMEKFEEAKSRENNTMIRSRKIAESLNLNMKIGDVEYQGDGNKAIFYYIADERVDFRELIKVLAETFKVRIEMKQIGARQEAGRIGGIGPCGRPLCCSSWMTNFVSVATSAARYQDISLNPQKLAGQCAKLKCCLNFEVDCYVESVKKMPPREARLETADSTYFHFKSDVFKREITYSTDKSVAANLVTIDADRAFEIIEMNRRGEKPIRLERDGEEQSKERKYNDILDQDNVARFDGKKRKKKPKKDRQRPQNTPQTQPAGTPDPSPERKDTPADTPDKAPAEPRERNNEPRDKNNDRKNNPEPRKDNNRDRRQRRDRRPRPEGNQNPERPNPERGQNPPTPQQPE